jgi:hypothetical protein
LEAYTGLIERQPEDPSVVRALLRRAEILRQTGDAAAAHRSPPGAGPSRLRGADGASGGARAGCAVGSPRCCSRTSPCSWTSTAGRGGAFSGILDQGSILFGAALVVIVSGIMGAGLAVQMMVTSVRMITRQAEHSSAARRHPPSARRGLPAFPSAPAATSTPTPGEAHDDESEMEPEPEVPSPYSLAALVSLTSSLGDVFGLALLYAPFALLALTVFEPVGSFGVAFRRDFGPLLACTFFAWAAARLPFALLSLALPLLGPGPSGLVGYLVLWATGGLVFAGLMVIALQTTFGARLGQRGRGRAHRARRSAPPAVPRLPGLRLRALLRPGATCAETSAT